MLIDRRDLTLHSFDHNTDVNTALLFSSQLPQESLLWFMPTEFSFLAVSKSRLCFFYSHHRQKTSRSRANVIHAAPPNFSPRTSDNAMTSMYQQHSPLANIPRCICAISTLQAASSSPLLLGFWRTRWMLPDPDTACLTWLRRSSVAVHPRPLGLCRFVFCIQCVALFCCLEDQQRLANHSPLGPLLSGPLKSHGWAKRGDSPGAWSHYFSRTLRFKNV